MRAITLGVGSIVAAALAIWVSLYTSAHAQTVNQGPPPAGPRGITGSQVIRQPPQRAGQFAQFGGGPSSIAADGGVVYVLRGNMLYAISGATSGRMRIVDQLQIPGPNRGPNQGRPSGQPPRANGQQGGNRTPPPK